MTMLWSQGLGVQNVKITWLAVTLLTELRIYENSRGTGTENQLTLTLDVTLNT